MRQQRDPNLKLKQGALDFNAYLIQRLRKDPSDPCIDLLYLNLKKLAQSADICMQLNQQEKCIVQHSHTVAAPTSSNLEQIEAWWMEDLERQ